MWKAARSAKERGNMVNELSEALCDHFSRGHAPPPTFTLPFQTSSSIAPHATEWPPLKSEQTSVSLRLLKTDKSLTSKCCTDSLCRTSLGYLTSRQDLLAIYSSVRICLPNIKLSWSQGAADSAIQGPAVVSSWFVLCGMTQGDFAVSVIKMCSAHRGCKQMLECIAHHHSCSPHI